MFKLANMRKSARLWLLYVLIILVLNSYLFIVTAGLTEGEYPGRAIVGNNDYSTYLAKMKIGYDSGWQYLNRYTTEPHDPSYIFLFYILLGHLAAALHLDLHVAFHLTRFILAFFALQVLYGFIRKYCGEREAMPVFLLAIFLSGSYLTSIDKLPQYHIYAGMMGYTHYMLTLICLLQFFAAVIDYGEDGKKSRIFKAVVTLNILALVHPFMVVLAGLVITGTVILSKKLVRTFPVLAAAALSSAPLMFYNYYIFTANPILAGWRAQAVTPCSLFTPLFLYGLGSVLAYAAMFLGVKGKVVPGHSTRLFTVWLLTALFLSYTDLITSNLQWFFFASLPAAGLAYKTIRHFAAHGGFMVRPKAQRIVISLLMLILTLPSVAVVFKMELLAFDLIAHKDKYPTYIISREDMECFDWLKRNADKNDIIMADHDTGNLIPFLTDSYTFIGHFHETMDYRNKKEQVGKFMIHQYSQEEAREFLVKNAIKYVINDRGAGPVYPFLKHVMTGKNFTIYRFTAS